MMLYWDEHQEEECPYCKGLVTTVYTVDGKIIKVIIISERNFGEVQD